MAALLLEGNVHGPRGMEECVTYAVHCGNSSLILHHQPFYCTSQGVEL